MKTTSAGLLCLLLPISVLSQTLLITEHSPSLVQLSAADSARFQQISDTAYSSDVRIVSIADIKTPAQQSDTVQFVLPGTSDTIIVEATQIEENNQLGFLWAGRLVNHQGHFAYNRKDNLTAGFLMYEGNFYEILPIDTIYQFFVKRSRSSTLGTCGVPSVELPPDITTEPECQYSPDYNTCPALITVLVIVDEFAKAYLENSWGGVGFFVKMGEIIVNIAFANSDIPNKSIRVVFVEKTGFEFSSNPINLDLDLAKLKTFSADERTANKADIVVLLTGAEQYPGALAGFASLDAPSFDDAFSIIEVDNFLTSGAFAHELGHLFGCRHNWPDGLGGNDDTEVCAHAYRNILTIWPPGQTPILKTWRTILGVPIVVAAGSYFQYDGVTYILNSEEMILHYSNPDVDYNGVPTGVTGLQATDNAQQIRNTGCDVADYFPNQELAVFVSSTSACDPPITFTANIIEPESGLPGVGPYTVTWDWSATGIFNSQTSNYLGTGTTIEVQICPTYWIRCSVVSSDNVYVSRSLKVQAPIWCECDLSPGGSEERPVTSAVAQPSVNFGELTIQPNPVFGNRVNVQSNYFSGQARYQFINLTGKVLSSGQINLVNQIPIGIPLPQNITGMVICRIILENGEPHSHKLIIQNH